MSGFENDVLIASNVNFDETAVKPHLGIIVSDGQLLIGNALAPFIRAGLLTSPLGTVTIGYSSPNITLEVAGGAVAVEHLTGNTGGQLNPTANNFNILGSGSISVAGSGSTLTISLTGGGFVWNDVSGAFSPLKENGYFVTGTATGTLPASPAQGDTIEFFVDNATQVLTIQASGTQLIRLGTLVSSAGGTAISTKIGDSLELVYRAANTTWEAVGGFSGTWIMA